MRFWKKIKEIWCRIFVGMGQECALSGNGETSASSDVSGSEGNLALGNEDIFGICEESKPKVCDDSSVGSVKKPKIPIDAGGKRGVLTKESGAIPNKNGDFSEPSSLSVKPELICRQSGWEWKILLFAPVAYGIDKVLQGEENLSRDGDYFCLLNFTSDIIVKYAAGSEDIVSFYDDFPVIFKLRGGENDIGRHVTKISRGDFVVMALKDWRRIGNVEREQENCADPNFAAHFFFADGAGLDGCFDGYQLPCGESEFQLQGQRIYDSNSDEVPLFVGPNPPALKLQDSVRTIRVGDEGCGEWRGDNYICDQPLQNILADKGKRQGWFYVRVYGGDDRKAMDSGGFRYCENLRKIFINGVEFGPQTLIMPRPDGHIETKIRFIGADGKNCHTENSTDSSYPCEDGAVVVPPIPQSDIRRTFTSKGQRSVDVRIIPPLVWWRIAKNGNGPEKWRDTPIRMTRTEFRNYAVAGVEIDILTPPGIGDVTAGFNGKCHRLLHKNKGKHSAEWRLPFDVFSDYEEFDMSASALALHIQCGEQRVAVVCIPEDMPALPQCIPTEHRALCLGGAGGADGGGVKDSKRWTGRF